MVRDGLGIFQLRWMIREIPRATSAALSGIKPLVSSVIAVLMMAALLIQTNQVLADQRDYTGWGLPDGAKARLGKGTFTGMQLSPDGARLAIASSTGVWLYDVSTGDEIALLTSIVRHEAF